MQKGIPVVIATVDGTEGLLGVGVGRGGGWVEEVRAGTAEVDCDVGSEELGRVLSVESDGSDGLDWLIDVEVTTTTDTEF